MAEWWREAVFYQIYPRSFMDANGDGIGDLRGAISRLDHLNDGKGGGLGVDALWFSPFFASPQRDYGYDISDYYSIAPEYGSMDDFKELLAQAHARGMRVVLDLVVNHSSDQHPWFLEARASKASPYHAYYLWAPMRGRRRPNNWRCAFTLGSAWHPNPTTGEWYLGTFTPDQPEFDWRHPPLKAAIHDILRFWLGLGADGYRLDVCTGYLKDQALRSNPLSPVLIPDMLQRHVYDRNQPEVHDILRKFRTIADQAGDKVLIGEPYGQDAALSASCLGRGDELHLAFDFNFTSQPFRPARFRKALETCYAALPEGGWAALALSNHDRPRAVHRYRSRLPGQAGLRATQGRARLLAAMLLSLRGTPFIYYGEEIGMGCRRLPRKALRDPLGKHTWPLGFIGRDPERRPMQWDGSPNAGFSSASPWLPVDPGYRGLNVKDQAGDPSSLLSFYKTLLRLRKAEPALRLGELRFLDGPPGILAYERRMEGRGIRVILNFKDRPASFRLDAPGSVLLSTARPAGQALGAGRIRLSARECLFLRS
jgi:alpha-glucosidase